MSFDCSSVLMAIVPTACDVPSTLQEILDVTETDINLYAMVRRVRGESIRFP